MSTKVKCTKLEKEKRIFMVQGWIIEGIQDRLIVKNIIEQWGLDVRQAQRYVRDAYESWKKIEGVNIDMKREMKIAELKQTKRSLKAEFKGTPAGISAIMAVEKEIIKLEGLELPKQIQVQTNIPALELHVINGKSQD